LDFFLVFGVALDFAVGVILILAGPVDQDQDHAKGKGKG
jgi:hypothetical protein